MKILEKLLGRLEEFWRALQIFEGQWQNPKKNRKSAYARNVFVPHFFSEWWWQFEYVKSKLKSSFIQWKLKVLSLIWKEKHRTPKWREDYSKNESSMGHIIFVTLDYDKFSILLSVIFVNLFLLPNL